MGYFNADNHIYSYSQLSSVDECPYGWYLQRIEKVPQVSNGFAEQGSLIHDLLDLWGKKILVTNEELVKEYERRYPNEVVTAWPRMLASKGYTEKAFLLGKEYFENFDKFEGYAVISTEERFNIDIEGRKVVGIIDMIVEDKKTGELIIVDHKSKSLTAFRKEADHMYRQQYLYAKYFIEKFGKPPARLMFNLFKEGGMKDERKWDWDFYNETINWAVSQIEKIENYEYLDWLSCKEPDFFCAEICGVRNECPNHLEANKPKPKTTRKKKS